MTQRVGRGGTAKFIDSTFTSAGVLIDPDNPLIDIIDPDQVEVVTNVVPERMSVGRYQYPLPGFPVPTDATLGFWLARWSADINGVPVSDDDAFEVVEAGEVDFPVPGSPLVTSGDVVDHVGAGDLDPGTLAALETQIALYTADLESILGRGVTRQVRTETRVIYSDPVPYEQGGQWGSAGMRLIVERGPVVSITSIISGVLTLEASSYTRIKDGAEVWGGSMVPGTDIVIVYDGGHDSPLPAKQAVMARAGRWLNKRTDDDVGVESSAVEGHTVKWMEDAFTDAELRACNRLRAPDMAG